jgi:hypothetical protein
MTVTKPRDNDNASTRNDGASHRIRLPGFITDADIGLGDAIKRATTYLGIRTCGGCKRRAAALNRWITFTR